MIVKLFCGSVLFGKGFSLICHASNIDSADAALLLCSLRRVFSEKFLKIGYEKLGSILHLYPICGDLSHHRHFNMVTVQHQPEKVQRLQSFDAIILSCQSHFIVICDNRDP